MKPKPLRNVSFLSASALLLLTSCAAQKQQAGITPKTDPFYSVKAEMTYCEEDPAVLTLTRRGDGLWEAEFSDPPALSGVLLSFDGSAVCASYKGLAFTVPKSAIPAKNMILLTTELLDSLDDTDPLPLTAQEDGTAGVSGESEAGSYTLTFTDTGCPAVFDMPSQPLHIVFSDYTVLTGETEETSTSATETTTQPEETTTTETTA